MSEFANSIKTAAASITGNGRFGRHKVFISALHTALCPRMSVECFKNLLIEAHRAGEIRLSRADLVSGMDKATIKASETAYMNGCWHLVNLEETSK